jgi:hypothetical protein
MSGSEIFENDSHIISWTVRGSNLSKSKRFPLFSKMSRPALWAHLASFKMDTGISSPGAKQPGREADLSPPSSDKVKKKWSYTSTTPKCLNGMDRSNIAILLRLIPHPTVTSGSIKCIIYECVYTN